VLSRGEATFTFPASLVQMHHGENKFLVLDSNFTIEIISILFYAMESAEAPGSFQSLLHLGVERGKGSGEEREASRARSSDPGRFKGKKRKERKNERYENKKI